MKFKSILFLLFLTVSLFPQNYYKHSKYWMTSPGAFKNGLYGFDNPALLVYQHQPDLYFAWTNQYGRWNDFNQWGLFAAAPNFSFSVMHEKDMSATVTDYKFSAGMGDRSYSVGFGYGWSRGNMNYFRRSNVFTLGASIRPLTFISVGVVGNFYNKQENEGIIDAAVRPFGNEIISLFGDYLFKKNMHDLENKWSAGIALEAYPGFRLTGRYFENKFFTVGVDLSFGRAGISSVTNLDKDGKYSFNSYGIRIGSYDRNILEAFKSKNNVVEFDMNGNVNYRKYMLFDDSRTLFDLIDNIKTAANDNTVSGIAINTSGMEAGREMMWELRDELRKFKEHGKKVYMYLDRGNIDLYHFASIADKIVLDPQGMLTIEGYVRGKTYYANTLEKIGVGFHEWRYFKYKSAVEVFSRTDMSEGDSVQLQSIVDDMYDLAKNDICKARNFSPERFDSLVNNVVMFIPEDAVTYGLVDEIGRWETLKDLLNKDSNNDQKYISPAGLTRYHLPEDNYWGEKPEIAVIYALGACAMDEGINARQLVKTVKAVGDNTNVKAVIFRVDSPGGDALASDIVAEALREIKKKKPVIVSQGNVAGSGGYWLSMYGDTIVAAPNTITGSIGVIGGWTYNKELKEKIGFSTDYVKRGEHADFGFGMTIPIIGMTLPDRDLTPLEMSKIDHIILSSYKDFVTKVASGRKKTYDEIHALGQGRVYTGKTAINNGLVDVIGGLQTAIDLAAKKSGLDGKQYQLKEYPGRPLINFGAFLPKIGITSGLSLDNIEKDPIINNLKFRIKNAGVPMPIIPLEDMDYIPSY